MDPVSMSTAYQKMTALCMNIKNEISTDIEIHNQHILPRYALILIERHKGLVQENQLQLHLASAFSIAVELDNAFQFLKIRFRMPKH